MPDVKCPYCGNYQDINHDDGYGLDESDEYEQECIHCEKTFKFFTRISFSYNVYCQDDDHDFQHHSNDDYVVCTKCDYIRFIRGD